MVVTLPIATIRRILDRVTILPEQASEFILGEALARVRADVETNSPRQTTNPLPKLPENIVSALEKARDDKTLLGGGKHVGHLRDWCRAMRLGSAAAAVEVAVTAAPEWAVEFWRFPREVDKSPQPGIELSAEEDEEESAAFWRYPPVSTPCTELFRAPA
jgi:hypothetical protein